MTRILASDWSILLLLGLGLQAQQVAPHVAAEQRHAALHQLPVLVLLQHQQGLHRLGDEPGACHVQEWLQPRLDTPRDTRLSYLGPDIKTKYALRILK